MQAQLDALYQRRVDEDVRNVKQPFVEDQKKTSTIRKIDSKNKIPTYDEIVGINQYEKDLPALPSRSTSPKPISRDEVFKLDVVMDRIKRLLMNSTTDDRLDLTCAAKVQIRDSYNGELILNAVNSQRLLNDPSIRLIGSHVSSLLWNRVEENDLPMIYSPNLKPYWDFIDNLVSESPSKLTFSARIDKVLVGIIIPKETPRIDSIYPTSFVNDECYYSDGNIYYTIDCLISLIVGLPVLSSKVGSVIEPSVVSDILMREKYEVKHRPQRINLLKLVCKDKAIREKVNKELWNKFCTRCKRFLELYNEYKDDALVIRMEEKKPMFSLNK